MFYFIGGAFQSIDVYENHVPGTVVGEVINAMDRDEHPKIFYHVISENGDRNQRTFDMERSKIILRKEIDREKLHRYNFNMCVVLHYSAANIAVI